MKWLLAGAVAIVVTGGLLWLVLTGATVWRKTAWAPLEAPRDGGIKIQFIRQSRDGGVSRPP